MSAPSPTPSNMPPPPTLKRPRQSAGTSTPTGAGGPSTVAANPRVKRRKNEVDDGAGAESSESGARGRGGASGSGAGAMKGKDEDGEEAGDISTKIDFRTLPVETLYKYLEHHDLLPRWDVSPWSEEPCVPPNALYSAAPPQTAGPASSDELGARSPSMNPQKPEDGATKAADPITQGNTSATQPDTVSAATEAGSVVQNGTTQEGGSTEPTVTNGNDHGDGTAGAEVEAEEVGEADTPAPPTTRSKTAPQRKQPTPDLSPVPAGDQQRPVITLSDVYAARDVLAERANAHWIKGLGGGQNKEGETIVNFLYKMKVGPGRLLRVYNPPPAAYGTL